MRTPILPLLLIACCVAGCDTLKKSGNQPPPSPPPPETNAAPVVEPEIVGTVPDEKKGLSDADIEELKHRLDLLKKGMTREQVLQILNLSSFDVRITSQASGYGIVYALEHGHRLMLSLEAGPDAWLFKWAEFDGALWPKIPVIKMQRTPSSQ